LLAAQTPATPQRSHEYSDQGYGKEGHGGTWRNQEPQSLYCRAVPPVSKIPESDERDNEDNYCC